uniref:Putative secreted protein n=1 Tax=Anopheles darlingi TaxID=43151 RepID=A0A2M4D1J0_ANODA
MKETDLACRLSFGVLLLLLLLRGHHGAEQMTCELRHSTPFQHDDDCKCCLVDVEMTPRALEQQALDDRLINKQRSRKTM